MDILLLIIFDSNLRQLYHELLLSKNIEVIPTNNISNATIMLTLNHVSSVVIYTDDTNEAQIEAFLRLYQKNKNWQSTKVILLASGETSYSRFLNIPQKDIILNPLLMSPVEVADKIKTIISNK